MRAGHGKGAGQPRIEVKPASELPVGLPWEPERSNEFELRRNIAPLTEDSLQPHNNPVSTKTQDLTPDLPPGGVVGPGAPPALIAPEKAVPITAEQLFPQKKGLFQKGNKLSELGGRAKAGTAKLLTEMGITRSASFKPFKAKAKSFARAQQNEMARSVGGGFCGPSPSSMIQSAAIQMAYAAWLQDKAERLMDDESNLEEVRQLLGEARTFQNSSRQNLLAAHEMCAREALSRRNSKTGPVTALEKAFGQ